MSKIKNLFQNFFPMYAACWMKNDIDYLVENDIDYLVENDIDY